MQAARSPAVGCAQLSAVLLGRCHRVSCKACLERQHLRVYVFVCSGKNEALGGNTDGSGRRLGGGSQQQAGSSVQPTSYHRTAGGQTS